MTSRENIRSYIYIYIYICVCVCVCVCVSREGFVIDCLIDYVRYVIHATY